MFIAARALHWQTDSYPLYHQGSPGFFHFIQCLIGSSMQCSINASFLLMLEKHSIDLYAAFCFSIYNFMVIWVVSSSGLLWKVLLYMFEYRFLWDVLRNCLQFLTQTSKMVLNRSSKSRDPHLVEGFQPFTIKYDVKCQVFVSALYQAKEMLFYS